MLTYSLHLWPMSSEGSLKCHTHCDTDLLYLMVIPKDPWHSHLLLSVWQWRCHYPFLQCRSVPTRDRSPFSHMRGWVDGFMRTLYHWATATVACRMNALTDYATTAAKRVKENKRKDENSVITWYRKKVINLNFLSIVKEFDTRQFHGVWLVIFTQGLETKTHSSVIEHH